MEKGFGQSDPRLARWIADTYDPEDELLREVRARSAAAGLPDIQVGALDGRHLEVLARATGARRAVEIGTLGGYSGVCILRGLAPGGVLHTFELDPRHADVARETFRLAGFGATAHVHVGPALEQLPAIEAAGPFDLVFVDADKVSYPAYLEWSARHLRPGGVLLADNAFLFGELPEQHPTGPRAEPVRAMQRFHQTLAHDGRFRATVLPTGEGLALAVRIG